MERRYYIFCYDVTSTSLSRKALQMAKKYSIRQQKSCFECFMSEEELQQMKEWIAQNFTENDKASIFEVYKFEESFRFGKDSQKDPFIFI